MSHGSFFKEITGLNNNGMRLFVSVFFTAFLMNAFAVELDSLQTKANATIIIDNKVMPVLKQVTTTNIASSGLLFNNTILKKPLVKFNFDILFPTGESTLNEVSKDALTKFSEYLNNNPSTEIAIVGHTDNVSLLEINQKLSEHRAHVVADYLISKNVNPSQLKEIKGKNYKEPIADNSTVGGRAVNRRVELIVLSAFPVDTAYNSAITEDSIQIKSVPDGLKELLEQVINHADKINEVEIEIDGLLVDDTKTKSGKDFYDLFYNNWMAPSKAKNYSITVSEKPFRLTSTMISVSINDNMVYQSILQPRQDIIESQTEEAIGITQEYLANYEEIMKQLNGDDMVGSGIY